MANSGYDRIAAEYYRPEHVTSRNFDHATIEALRTNPFDLPDSPDALVLEIGAGKGRANEFLGIAHTRVVQLDNSRTMFELPDRESSLLQVLGDACDIPLVSAQFSAVIGFLVDPFIGLDCLAEAHRMLEIGGRLFLTVPTKDWGAELRRHLDIDEMTTRFKLIGTETTVALPSLLHSKDEINAMLEHTEFRQIEILDHCLPETEDPVSADIEYVCSARGIANHQLPVVHTIRALR